MLNTHKWRTFDGMIACAICGVVERADGKNNDSREIIDEYERTLWRPGCGRTDPGKGARDE